FINSRKQAASTLYLELSNVFGTIKDAQRSGDLTHTSLFDLVQTLLAPGVEARLIEQRRNINHKFAGMLLRTGARVHFRMGYGSNPMLMPTIINGTVTELRNNGETVSVIVQDDGIELTNLLIVSPDEETGGFIRARKEPMDIVDDILTGNEG